MVGPRRDRPRARPRAPRLRRRALGGAAVTAALAEVEDAIACAAGAVVRLPALVGGRLVLAPAGGLAAAPAGNGRFAPARAERLAAGDVYALRRPVLDPARLEPTGDTQTIVLPVVDAASLLPAPEATEQMLRL